MKIKMAFLTVFVFFSTHSMAAQPSAANSESSATGQRLFVTLRAQINTAEDKVYSLYNELNSDDEFDIQCRMVAELGSKLKKKECNPNFLYEATANTAAEFFGTSRAAEAATGISGFSSSSNSVSSVLHTKNPILKENLLNLARENPELGQAIIKHYDLNVELQESLDSYYGRTSN